MFKPENIGKTITSTIITVLFMVVSFFSVQTFNSIKSMEKEVITIRVKLAEFEASRITREEIKELIKDYHENHPQYVPPERK